jgi:two-component sensor histidine kinase
LQVIASITRMQARRAKHAETRLLLDETVNRIMSMAVVHEFLSQNDKGNINLLDVAHRIVQQVQQGLIAPEQQIRLSVDGPSIWLPADKATRCALIVNELLQNAIEHGMAGRTRGAIQVVLVDHGDKASIMVSDDGQGLPEDFTLGTHANLGLRIVSGMVERDLGGVLTISRSDGETRADIEFPK